VAVKFPVAKLEVVALVPVAFVKSRFVKNPVTAFSSVEKRVEVVGVYVVRGGGSGGGSSPASDGYQGLEGSYDRCPGIRGRGGKAREGG
jgi:hypothetical protein